MAFVSDEGVRNSFLFLASSLLLSNRDSVSGPVCALNYGTEQSGGTQKRRN